VSDLSEKILDRGSEGFGLSRREFSGEDSLDLRVEDVRRKMEFRLVRGLVSLVVVVVVLVVLMELVVGVVFSSNVS